MNNTLLSAPGRAVMAEQRMVPNPMQGSPAQQAGLVSLDSLLRMQAQINYLRNALPPQQAPRGSVAEDMQQQLRQMEGINSLPVDNVGDERAYNAGGIVAFANRGEVNGKDREEGESDEEYIRRVARETEEQNQRIMEGGFTGLKAAAKFVLGAINPLSYVRDRLHYNPETGQAWIGGSKAPTPMLRAQHESDQDVWDEYYRQNQGLLSGASPSRQQLEEAMSPEDRAKAEAFRASQAARRAGPTPGQIQNALTGATDLTRLGSPQVPSLIESKRPPFALRPPGFMEEAAAEERSKKEKKDKTDSGLGATPEGRAAKGEKATKETEDPYKIRSLKERYEELADIIGPNKAAEEYGKYIEELKKSGEKTLAEDRRLALSRAGFAMAAAAGKRGQPGSGLSKFLGAAAAGGESYAAALPEINKNMRALNQKIAEDQFRLADAERKERTDLAKAAESDLAADRRAMMQLQGQREIIEGQERRAYAAQAARDKLELDRYIRTLEGQTAAERKVYIQKEYDTASKELQDLRRVQSSSNYALMDDAAKKQITEDIAVAQSRLNSLRRLGGEKIGLETAPAATGGGNLSAIEAEAARRGLKLPGQ